MTWASPSRVLKPEMRDYLLETDHPYHRAIFLPGWDDQVGIGCLCIRRALEIGAVTESTEIIAVERVGRLARKIADDIVTLGFNTIPALYRGELADLSLTPDSPVDFAMLDLLGTLDLSLAQWLEGMLGPSLAPNASLSFTMTRHFRNNRFMENMVFAWRRSPQLRRQAFRYSQQVGIQQDEELIHHAIIKSCLCRFSFDYRPVQIYRDKRRTMLAFRFDNLQPTEPSWPSLAEVMIEFDRAVTATYIPGDRRPT